MNPILRVAISLYRSLVLDSEVYAVPLHIQWQDVVGWSNTYFYMLYSIDILLLTYIYENIRLEFRDISVCYSVFLGFRCVSTLVIQFLIISFLISRNLIKYNCNFLSSFIIRFLDKSCVCKRSCSSNS